MNFDKYQRAIAGCGPAFDKFDYCNTWAETFLGLGSALTWFLGNLGYGRNLLPPCDNRAPSEFDL